jgi:hypothetical protein
MNYCEEKEKEKEVLILFKGDKEDYVNTLKALVHMLGNQKTEVVPSGMHLYSYCNLIEDMLNQL